MGSMRTTVFDNDFTDEDFVLIYESGDLVFDGPVYELTPESRKHFDGADWYLLDSLELRTAIFVL